MITIYSMDTVVHTKDYKTLYYCKKNDSTNMVKFIVMYNALHFVIASFALYSQNKLIT